MTRDELQGLLSDPDTHWTVVQDYAGPYSLGIKPDYLMPDAWILCLRVPLNLGFPKWVMLSGERVRVVVEEGFGTPQAL